ITAVLSADYLYWILKSPKYAIGIGSSFSTDLLGYFIPTTKTWIGGSGFHSAYTLFDTGAENGAYLGVPLILITVRWICTHWQLRVSRFLTAALCVSILWTFGPTLHVAGQPTIWMPYRLLLAYHYVFTFFVGLQGVDRYGEYVGCAIILQLDD